MRTGPEQALIDIAKAFERLNRTSERLADALDTIADAYEDEVLDPDARPENDLDQYEVEQ